MGDLNTFPVSYKVKGRRIVIIGGGEEALNKARLASKTTASVVIISQHVSVDFSEVGIVPAVRQFHRDDLSGSVMVFIAEESDDAEAAAHEARRLGIPAGGRQRDAPGRREPVLH